MTSRLSREHVVAHPVPGLVMVAGGKYTTYRVMAKDAVDAVAHGLDGGCPPSCTEQVPLVGARRLPAAVERPAPAGRAPPGCTSPGSSTCCGRYGSLADEILDLVAAEPGLGRPLAGADDYLRAEIVYAASHEGARHVDDVLARRTRISIETWDRGLSAAAEAADLMAKPLRWDARQVAREVNHYEATIEAERASQEAPTDQAADALLLDAPEIVPVIS